MTLLSELMARGVPEFGGVVAKYADRIDGRKFLLVPFHFVGKASMEQGRRLGRCGSDGSSGTGGPDRDVHRGSGPVECRDPRGCGGTGSPGRRVGGWRGSRVLAFGTS